MIGLTGTTVILLAAFIGTALTSLIWIRVGPALRKNHEMVQSVYEDAKANDKKKMSAMYGSPMKTTGPIATALQFLLLLVPITLVTYYLLTKI